MSDHTLSSLRRRARQTGSVEDRAAVLVARLRAGTLTRERVELAAYCGDEAARAGLGGWPCCHFHSRQGMHEKFPCVPKPATLPSLVGGLSRWSDLHPRAPGWVLVRAAVAAARVALPIHEAAKTTISYDADLRALRLAPRRAIEAAEAWLACPCGKHREDLLAAVLSRRGAHFRDPCARCGTPHDDVAPGPCPGLPAWALGCSDVLFADGVHENGAPVWHRGPRGAARLAGEQPVREAVCHSLVEWALSEDA